MKLVAKYKFNTKSKYLQGSYKVFEVLEVLEFYLLTFQSWKTLGNSHINDEVHEKCLFKDDIYEFTK